MPPQSWANRTDVRRPDRAAAPAPEPTALWDTVQANWRDGRDNGRRNARYEALDGDRWERHRQIEQRLGRRLPLSRSLAGVSPGAGERGFLDRFLFDPEAINATILGRPGLLEDDAYEALIESERTKNPEALTGIPSIGEMTARLDKRLRETRQEAQQGEGITGVAGSLIGQGAALFTDPAEVGVVIATGGLGAGRSLLARMAAQGAVGAGAAASGIGDRRVDAEIAGPEFTTGEALLEVGLNAVGGAGGEAVFAGGRAAFRPLAERLAGSAEPADRGVSRQIERLLIDEDILGGADDFDGARQALAEGAPIPRVEPERDLDDLFANQSPRPVSGGVRLSQPESAGGLQATEYRGRPIYSGRFDPMTVEVDAARFQYKAEGDADGVTARLRGVERWDATASGKAILFEDIDGRVIVADGHQRRGLARRLAEQGWDDAQLDGMLFKASDGWTPREVRMVAALKNMREGSGTPMDAAKVFREAPQALDDRSLPLTGDFIQQARNLSALSDDGFRAVINGVIPERYGAIIGEQAAGRAEIHADLVELLRQADPKSVEGARAMVQEGLLDDFLKTEGRQMDLFGGLPRESTLIARGRIREAVMSGLRKDERLNAALVRNADAIEAGGNILARSDNEKKLAIDRAASELVSRLALRSGEMGEAFQLAASAVTKGETSAGAAAKGLIQRIRSAVAAGERLDVERAQVLDPPAPSPQALKAVADFDQPGGPGARSQIVDKPEEVEIEAEAASMGLFDDLPETVSEERALGVLRACAPGKAA